MPSNSNLPTSSACTKDGTKWSDIVANKTDRLNDLSVPLVSSPDNSEEEQRHRDVTTEPDSDIAKTLLLLSNMVASHGRNNKSTASLKLTDEDYVQLTKPHYAGIWITKEPKKKRTKKLTETPPTDRAKRLAVRNLRAVTYQAPRMATRSQSVSTQAHSTAKRAPNQRDKKKVVTKTKTPIKATPLNMLRRRNLPPNGRPSPTTIKKKPTQQAVSSWAKSQPEGELTRVDAPRDHNDQKESTLKHAPNTPSGWGTKPDSQAYGWSHTRPQPKTTAPTFGEHPGKHVYLSNTNGTTANSMGPSSNKRTNDWTSQDSHQSEKLEQRRQAQGPLPILLLLSTITTSLATVDSSLKNAIQLITASHDMNAREKFITIDHFNHHRANVKSIRNGCTRVLRKQATHPLDLYDDTTTSTERDRYGTEWDMCCGDTSKSSYAVELPQAQPSPGYCPLSPPYNPCSPYHSVCHSNPCDDSTISTASSHYAFVAFATKTTGLTEQPDTEEVYSTPDGRVTRSQTAAERYGEPPLQVLEPPIPLSVPTPDPRETTLPQSTTNSNQEMPYPLHQPMMDIDAGDPTDVVVLDDPDIPTNITVMDTSLFYCETPPILAPVNISPVHPPASNEAIIVETVTSQSSTTPSPPPVQVASNTLPSAPSAPTMPTLDTPQTVTTKLRQILPVPKPLSTLKGPSWNTDSDDSSNNSQPSRPSRPCNVDFDCGIDPDNASIQAINDSVDNLATEHSRLQDLPAHQVVRNLTRDTKLSK